jgi:cold shock CspA family protein
MRGSITQIIEGGGAILAEDGCEVFFDQDSTGGVDYRRLTVGQWVEFEEQHCGARSRAVKIRPLQMQACPHDPKSGVSFAKKEYS